MAYTPSVIWPQFVLLYVSPLPLAHFYYSCGQSCEVIQSVPGKVRYCPHCQNSCYHLFPVTSGWLLFLQSPPSRSLPWGTWVAQSVKCSTSAQGMISPFVSSSPTPGSGLTAWSLEPASDSVSPSLSAPPPLMLCLLSLKNKH